MPRPIWSGSISFGLVNVPVKLLTAVSPKDVRFHQIDSRSKARVKQKRVSSTTGEEVPFEEIVKGYEIDGLPGDEVEVSDKEMKIARSLIDSLSTDFEPAKYRDEYRDRVLEMIEAKAEGQEIVVSEAPAEEPAKVVDLMAALEASLGEVKKARAKKGA